MRSRQGKTRFTLVQKLILSYVAMAFFTMGALVYAVMGLNSLHKSAREIADSDLVLIGLTEKMRESSWPSSVYAGKYAILKEAEFADLFRRREVDFLDLLRPDPAAEAGTGPGPAVHALPELPDGGRHALSGRRRRRCDAAVHGTEGVRGHRQRGRRSAASTEPEARSGRRPGANDDPLGPHPLGHRLPAGHLLSLVSSSIRCHGPSTS